MNKDDEINGDRQAIHGEKTISKPKKNKSNARKHNLGRTFGSEQNKNLSRKKKALRFNDISIPSVNFNVKDTTFDKIGISECMETLEISMLDMIILSSKLIPQKFFDETLSESGLLNNIINQINEEYSEYEISFHPNQNNPRVVLRMNDSFSFSHLYLYNFESIYAKMPKHISKVYFNFIRLVCEQISAPFMNFDYSYIEEMMDPEEQDEEGVRYHSHIPEIVQTAYKNSQAILDLSREINLSLIKDEEWIAEFMLYNGFAEDAKDFIEIVYIIKHFNPDFQGIEMEEDVYFNFVNLMILEETLFEDAICSMAIESANEHGLGIKNEFIVYKEETEELSFLNNSSLEPYYLDLILILLFKIIQRHE